MTEDAELPPELHAAIVAEWCVIKQHARKLEAEAMRAQVEAGQKAARAKRRDSW